MAPSSPRGRFCPSPGSWWSWRRIIIIIHVAWWSWAFLLCMMGLGTVAADVEESFNAESWLRQFGYLSQASRQMSTMQSAQILSKAVADMQRFYGLEVTGEMNAGTLKAMRRPRCGLPDKKADEMEGGARKRRYALTGQQWDKDQLTYSIVTQQFPTSLGEERVLGALRKAFDVWRRVTPLTFEEIPAENNYNNINNNSSSQGPLADILMLFASGFHGDMSLFDGEGGSLAHAYYPGPGTGGDVHFDADEPWTLDNEDPKGIDVFLVAVHELGHALGLEHSDEPSAMMAPFYQWMDTQDFTLPQDDVRGIQYIYGSPLPTDTPSTSAPSPTSDGDSHSHSPTSPPPPEGDPTPPQAPTDDDPPDTPPPPPPTALDPPDPPQEPGDPSLPSALPPTLSPPTDPQPDPEPVTPTMRRPSPPPPPPRPPKQPDHQPPPPPPPRPPKQPDHQAPDICDGDFDTVTVLRGEMFVFKGGWFWRVRRNRVLDNYPMPISVFWIGLPSDIDAAYERHDGKFVFFKDDRYWLFREADVVPGYPQPLEEYGRGVPADRIDTAIWWEPNGFTYFFRGDRYWRYNEESRSTDPDFPKPISRWGGIPSSPNGAFLSDDGAYTYFYKGSNYWRFDNSRTKADKGYPRSILKDFMGCQGLRDPAPDPDPDDTDTTDADGDRRPPPAVPSDRGPPDPDEDDYDNRVPDAAAPPPDTDTDTDQVNVVVRVAPENDSKVMTLVMVTAPLVLVLCILVLVYAILRTLNRKETPRALVHCKRSLQDWV